MGLSVLVGMVAGFVLGLKVGITLGHRAEQRVQRARATASARPKGDEARAER